MMTVGTDNTPFFILGCVRSGTTLLRNILRLHPRLECPEETHFFRWADPFCTKRYIATYRASILKQHRTIDGIDNFQFMLALQSCKNRKQMADWYGQAYLHRIGNPKGRWFDKTPQNVYGILLIASMYPTAKFIHIHRIPLNVTASLREGRVMPVHTVLGAINYWLESMIIIDQSKQLMPKRFFELSYEHLVHDAQPVISKLLHFLNEDEGLNFKSVKIHPERNKYEKLLAKEEIELVKEWTEPFFTSYGYSVSPA